MSVFLCTYYVLLEPLTLHFLLRQKRIFIRGNGSAHRNELDLQSLHREILLVNKGEVLSLDIQIASNIDGAS